MTGNLCCLKLALVAIDSEFVLSKTDILPVNTSNFFDFDTM
jgi:hypothetical protein